MADTQRSRAAILALLADNNTGDISAQDLRDAVVTAFPGYGEIYISSSAATTISVQNTWYPVAGTWTLGNAYNFSNPSLGRLQFDGDTTRLVLLWTGLSMTSAASNVTTGWAFSKNGVILDKCRIQRKMSTAGDIGTASVVGITTMDPGDYVDLRCRNLTSATNVTASICNLTVMAMPA